MVVIKPLGTQCNAKTSVVDYYRTEFIVPHAVNIMYNTFFCSIKMGLFNLAMGHEATKCYSNKPSDYYYYVYSWPFLL